MNSPPAKDSSIIKLLEQLRKDIGADAFEVVDHWVDDAFAIGVALPSDHRVLVYISTSANVADPDLYSYYLELPPNSADAEYADAGGAEECSYETLLVAIRSHWNLKI